MKRSQGLSTAPEHRTVSDIIRLSTDFIFSEANTVVLNFEKKYNKPVSKVILSGGGSMLKGLRDLAAIQFKSEVVLGDPFEKVGAPAFLGPVLREVGPEFSVALGLALRQLQD